MTSTTCPSWKGVTENVQWVLRDKRNTQRISGTVGEEDAPQARIKVDGIRDERGVKTQPV